MKVFKRQYTKPRPEGAKILRRRGGKVAQWCTRGQVKEAKLTTAGDRILCKSRHWYIAFADSMQIKHTVKAFIDEAATRVLADQVKRLLGYRAVGQEPDIELITWFADRPEDIREQLVKAGLLDPADDRDDALFLDDLVCEFERHLSEEKERCAPYVVGQVNILRRVFGDCEFVRWDDITVDRVRSWLQAQRKGGDGCSKRTYNQFVQTLRQFAKYAIEELEIAEVNPLAKLRPLPKPATDQRHPRRILTPDELQRVMQAAAAGPVRKGLDGRTRALLYAFMAGTGLRLNECRCLLVSDLRLTGPAPYVRVKPLHTKNSKPAEQPLNRELAAALKAFVQETCKLPGARLFCGDRERLHDHACEAFAADLESAGIEYQDAAGDYADLHSLRHFYGTRLAESGLSIHEVQKLMRHSDIGTTAKYMHPAKTRLRDAVERLPKLSIRTA